MQAIFAGLGVAAARVGTFLVQFVGFLAVLLIGWIVARIVQSAIAGILHRANFDRLVERGGVNKALARSKYDAAGILARIGFWAVMLVTLQLGFSVFGPNPVSAILTGIVAYLPRLFAAGLIVVVGAALAGIVREIIDAAIGNLSYGATIAGVTAGAIIYVTAFMALDQLGIAPAIVQGLFYASLAAIAGTIIVAAGGGGIPVMTQWWQRASTRVEAEAPMIAEQTQGASERVKQRAQERTQQAKQMAGTGGRDRGGSMGGSSGGPSGGTTAGMSGPGTLHPEDTGGTGSTPPGAMTPPQDTRNM
jgi:hypothetical protein